MAYLASNEEPVFDLPYLQHNPSYIYPQRGEQPSNHQWNSATDDQASTISLIDIFYHLETAGSTPRNNSIFSSSRLAEDKL